MLVSRNLLITYAKNFANVKLNDFINVCNRIGIEVEQVIYHPKTKGLKVVKIIDIKKHPNADKLNLVNIEVNNKSKWIVCGANNLNKNKYAIYADVGTVLYNGVTLTKKNIRGIDSEGMLCSLEELTNVGIDNFSNMTKKGIILLNKKIKDSDISHFLGLDDVIYDLSIPSNRNDLNSIYCLLAELSLHLSLNFYLPKKFIFPKKNSNIKILLDKKIVNDFVLFRINELRNFELLWREKEILSSCGFKVNDNILDLINMIFILAGNPLHTYSSRNIKLPIKILNNDKTYNVHGLDNVNYSIPKNSIICMDDKKKILSIPGIIGMEEFKYNVNDSLLIEIGNFNNVLIKNTNDNLKINTKSSQIASKKTSSYNTQLAFNLLCKFLDEYKIKFEVNYALRELKYKEIPIDYNMMEKFIGIKFNHQEILELINKTLLFSTKKIIKVHPCRLDIENVYDVYEEVMKIIDINQLDNIPINFSIIDFNNLKLPHNNIHNWLLNNGFIEVKTYNLATKKYAESFDFLKLFSNIKLLNSISNAREYLKSNSISQMLNIFQYNYSRKHTLYNMYEISKIQTDLKTSIDLINIIFLKDFLFSKVNQSLVKNDLLNIKSFVKNMLNDYSIEFKNINDKISILINNKVLGYIFKIDQLILEEYHLKDYKNDVYGLVFILDNKYLKQKNESVNNISIFPYILRDYNIQLNKDDDSINEKIKKIKTLEEIIDIKITDKYSKDNDVIYTLSLTISNISKTLTSDEINVIIDKINQLIK